MHRAIFCIVLLTLAGCRSTQPATTAENPELRVLSEELEKVQRSLERVENRLGHLASEVSAANPEHEFTEFVIDEVRWADDRGLFSSGSQDDRVLWCHASEWRGYGKMLRFTRMADKAFTLEAEGREPISASMHTGGVCNDDGSQRYVVLGLNGRLDPGVAYRLRPRNENESYRWSVAKDVVVQAN